MANSLSSAFVLKSVATIVFNWEEGLLGFGFEHLASQFGVGQMLTNPIAHKFAHCSRSNPVFTQHDGVSVTSFLEKLA